MGDYKHDFKDKYLVFPVGEQLVPKNLITDAVVIRLQDTFAPGALWAYANSVATILDLFDEYELETQTRADLEQVHEYFIAMAVRADEVRRKFPTP